MGQNINWRKGVLQDTTGFCGKHCCGWLLITVEEVSKTIQVNQVKNGFLLPSPEVAQEKKPFFPE